MDDDNEKERRKPKIFKLRGRKIKLPPKPPPPSSPLPIKRFFEKFLKNIDPFGITDLVEFFRNQVRNEKISIEEKFQSSRDKLRQFIDSIMNFFNLDFYSEKLFVCVQKVLNNILAKTYQIEVDVAGVKKIIFQLYPIRRLLGEHQKVIDILSNY